MWFILPDEGKTVDDVLADGEYLEMLRDFEKQTNQKWMKVNLSVPKFDVSAGIDLKEALRAAGITKLFEPVGNDFSPSIRSTNANNDPAYLESIHQDTRVMIDEEGVTGASYIELDFAAKGMEPPEEIMDFVLDRPFAFAVVKEQIPLFMGTVNAP